MKLLIVYDSWAGHCAVAARALADGARFGGGEPVLRKVDEVRRDDFQGIDGLVTGSPVHQRGMSWPMKRFIDQLCEPAWLYDELVGKVGGVFTVGGGHGDVGGGAEAAQQSLLVNLAAMGCVLVSFPKSSRGYDVAGMHWGPHVRTTTREMTPFPPDAMPEEALAGCYNHGAGIARVGLALKAQSAHGPIFEGGARWPTPEFLEWYKAHAQHDVSE